NHKTAYARLSSLVGSAMGIRDRGMVSKVKFMKMSALVALERTDEALQFSRQWLEEEGDNMDAIAANIYSYTAVRDMKTADELVRRHIPEGTKCRSKNNILFAAASTLYEEAGNEKEKNRIDQEIAAYIERLKDYYMGGVKEKNGSPQDDDELPF
ncbi:MAG: hypothetical protein K2O97_05325, partial [Acetatifactor sp.]|nr:hypothetical protein [Acetatifactor sp.]